MFGLLDLAFRVLKLFPNRCLRKTCPCFPKDGVLPQLLHLGYSFEWRSAVQYDAIAAVPVVWHFVATSLPGLLLRLPKTGVSASCSHQYDSTSGTDAALVHECSPMYSGGWNSAVRSCVHRIVLRVLGHLAEPVLLPIWIPLLGVLHLGGELWPDIHCDDVLPALWRRLQMVVADVHCVGWIGCIYLLL